MKAVQLWNCMYIETYENEELEKKMDGIFGSQENDARKWNKLGERNYLMAVQRLNARVFTYYVDKNLDSTW